MCGSGSTPWSSVGVRYRPRFKPVPTPSSSTRPVAWVTTPGRRRANGSIATSSAAASQGWPSGRIIRDPKPLGHVTPAPGPSREGCHASYGLRMLLLLTSLLACVPQKNDVLDTDAEGDADTDTDTD